MSYGRLAFRQALENAYTCTYIIQQVYLQVRMSSRNTRKQSGRRADAGTSVLRKLSMRDKKSNNRKSRCNMISTRRSWAWRSVHPSLRFVGEPRGKFIHVPNSSEPVIQYRNQFQKSYSDVRRIVQHGRTVSRERFYLIILMTPILKRPENVFEKKKNTIVKRNLSGRAVCPKVGRVRMIRKTDGFLRCHFDRTVLTPPKHASTHQKSYFINFLVLDTRANGSEMIINVLRHGKRSFGQIFCRT